MASRERILESFRADQRALAAQAEIHASSSEHGPSIGSAREELVRGRLMQYMPAYGYVRGEITAPDLGPSREWDVIVYDSTVGLNLTGDSQPGIVGIEAVLAVVSVKSNLNTAAIEECAEAAAELRAMHVGQAGERPIPAVFAFGFKGLTAANLSKAAEDACAVHGPPGAINGLLVLGSACVTALGPVECHDEGQDAWARWLATVQDTLQVAPRSPVRLSSYFYATGQAEEPRTTAKSFAGNDDPDGAVEPDGPVLDIASDLLRIDERASASLSTSLQLRRIVDELSTDDPEGATTLSRAIADDARSLEAIAEQAVGLRLEAAARMLLVLERVSPAVQALNRRIDEPDAPRVELLGLIADHDPSDEAEERLHAAARAQPTNSGYAIREALRLEAPDSQLEALRCITASSDRQRALLVAGMASALSALGRDADGIADVRAALALRWSPLLAERLAIMLLRREESAASPDAAAYVEAADLLSQVAVESLATEQPGMALQIDSRLLGVLQRLGRPELVPELAEWWLVSGIDTLPTDARTTMALALLDCDELALARRFAPARAPASPASRLLMARVALAEGRIEAAVETLDALLADESLEARLRSEVAHARLIASSDFDAEWNESAAELLDDRKLYAAALHAAHLSRRDRIGDAEMVLLPYSDTVNGKRALIDLLAEQQQWEKVLSLVESLGTDPPKVELFRKAVALHEIGRITEAEELWTELLNDEKLSYFRREQAAFRAASSLAERQQWGALAEFATRWHAVLPASPKAPWAAADALARVGDPVAALSILDAASLEPGSDNERLLVAQLASQSLSLPEALQRIADLSDEIDRRDERLEAMLITVSAGEAKDDLPPELEARVRLTFTDFSERFPESEIIQAEPIDDGSDWIRRLEAQAKHRHLFARRIQEQIWRGQASLSLLCLLGRTPLEVWLFSNVLPLTYPVDAENRDERKAADAAIAGAASWDLSTLAVHTLLGADLRELMASSLPGSTIARAAAADFPRARHGLASLDPDRSPGSFTFDSDGQSLQIVENNLDVLNGMRDRLDSAESSLARLVVRDPDASGEQDLERALRDTDLDPSASTWLGAIAVAQQANLPFFSDDRYLRRFARQLGVPTFGTVGLLAALEARGAISQAQLDAALWDLRSGGGRYLSVSANDLTARVRADGFELTRATATTVLAPEGWAVEPAVLLAAWHAALAASYVERPDTLDDLVHSVLRASAVGRGTDLSSCATLLVLATLASPAPLAAGYLTSLFRSLRRHTGSGPDPIDLAMAEVTQRARATSSGPLPVWHAFSRLPISEQLRLVGDDPLAPGWKPQVG
ncbi:hypothetical protein C7Y72_11685 [Paraconexibacter algicola]|uniref:Tetratricopeptide repeat protein n=1 Tax=Paraconexibacter algicola TaxID=2133960 RepID=A0A2T4UM26_9ACTN|nr:hypothetical protein C7Y72_11685 [Paraconexibacter algicola]